MSRLTGKNVVITGASSGLGEHIAYETAKRGGNVILLARSSTKLEKMVSDIKGKFSVKASFYTFDICDDQNVNEVFKEIYKKWETIDILVNNAGFGIFENVIDADLQEMQKMFEVNVFGLMNCCKRVLPAMLERNAGHIINIGSQAGKISTPKSSAYCATKHAVIGFSNSLRLEVVDTSINVTVVNPGPMKTNFLNIADPSGNYVKNAGKFMLSAERVSKKVVDVMEKPKREVNIPLWMSIGSKFYALFPSVFERLAKRSFQMK
jgi:uncharacterized protein